MAKAKTIENLEENITVEDNNTTTTFKRVDFNYPRECTVKRKKLAYLNSKKYKTYRDILNATLQESEEYTEQEVVGVIEEYLNKGVR